MKSHSQAGQDLWVAHVLNYKRGGTFLDIGCNHPVLKNNTFALESELGWRGFMLDGNQEYVDLCNEGRQSLAKQGDATTFDYEPNMLALQGDGVIDWLSLDVDEAQVDALRAVLIDAKSTATRFRAITAETDLYRFGPERHDLIIRLLKDAGYTLIANEVSDNGCKFETFWVDANLVDMKRVMPFESTGLDWKDVLKKGGIEP